MRGKIDRKKKRKEDDKRLSLWFPSVTSSSVRRGCSSSCSCSLFLSTLSSRQPLLGNSHLFPFSASLLPLHHSVLLFLFLFLSLSFSLLFSASFSSSLSLSFRPLSFPLSPFSHRLLQRARALATYPPICLPIYLSLSRSTAACRARHVHRREVEERRRLVRISSKLTEAPR